MVYLLEKLVLAAIKREGCGSNYMAEKNQPSPVFTQQVKL